MFSQKSHITPFFDYLNSLHVNIRFTKEEESGEWFPFLDIRIMKNNNTFATSTYYKPTHTGLYTDWYSFTPRKYKINLIKTLLFRAWKICSGRERFNGDMEIIRKNLLKNKFPPGLLDAVIKNFVANKTSAEPAQDQDTPSTVPKKEVFLFLPYFGTLSENFEKSLKSIVHDAYKQVELKVVFRTTKRLTDLFKIKDIIPKRLKSKLVYGIYCTDCTDFYIGKTKRHLSKRFKEHRDFTKPTAVTSHLISTGHDANFDRS